MTKAYLVGASKERVPAIRQRLLRDGIDVAGHCDHPRGFRPPRDASFVLLITDMGCHAALGKAREYCRATGLPCVGGVWRTWSTTRERLSALAQGARASCPGVCPLAGPCPAGAAAPTLPPPAGRAASSP